MFSFIKSWWKKLSGKILLGVVKSNFWSDRSRIRLVKGLLACGADPNVGDRSNDTPLHIATKKGNLEIVKALLNNQADVNAKNKDGNTPLHIAVEKANYEIAKLLIEKKANPDIKNVKGDAPLHSILSNCGSEAKIELTELLLEKGAGINVQNSNGYRPIYYAIVNDDTKVAKLLIDRGALNDDYRVISNSNVIRMVNRSCTLRHESNTLTFLHIAVKESSHDMVKLLLDAYKKRQPNEWSTILNNFFLGDIINVKDEHGRTPLHYAVTNNKNEIVKVLLECEGISISDDNRRTALNIAKSNNNQEIVNMLQTEKDCTSRIDIATSFCRTIYNDLAIYKFKTVGRENDFATYLSYLCYVGSDGLNNMSNVFACDKSMNKCLRTCLSYYFYGLAYVLALNKYEHETAMSRGIDEKAPETVPVMPVPQPNTIRAIVQNANVLCHTMAESFATDFVGDLRPIGIGTKLKNIGVSAIDITKRLIAI